MNLTNLPEAVLLKARNLGSTGEQWIATLEETVSYLALQWQFVPQEILRGGSESLVLLVDLEDGSSAVLKVGLPNYDCRTEAHVLQIANGVGYPRLIEHDEVHNALLLERLGETLADSNLAVSQQIETLCQTLQEAWIPLESSLGLMTGSEKARWLSNFIETTWRELDKPCAEITKDLALAFAMEREAAFNPNHSVLIHGDAHSQNTLRSLDGKGRYKFVDPDGLFAEPACDLAVPMREWNDELLEGDAITLGQARCRKLAMLTSTDERAIWQWGFMERVSTGLLLLRIGMTQAGVQTLTIADLWSNASISWNR
ncbi:aminoglycoside phosphotransferase family protein [Scytonema sp. NUACC26]|uniref:aminoglycoside phosphotransferase family protein n=1 Tax=Scytonema sp. NUACC26 TaxID=3140176 RepID=UPI0034DBC9C2